VTGAGATGPASSAPPLPYARGAILGDTADDFAKLRRAWAPIEERRGDVLNFTGLERSLGRDDDDLAPALCGARLTELALEHLGGEPGATTSSSRPG
jgi:hypothetical protein